MKKVLSNSKELSAEETKVLMGEEEPKTEKEQLEDDYKYLAAAYQLICEGLFQGKNTFTVKDTLEHLDKRFKEVHDKLKELEE